MAFQVQIGSDWDDDKKKLENIDSDTRIKFNGI